MEASDVDRGQPEWDAAGGGLRDFRAMRMGFVLVCFTLFSPVFRGFGLGLLPQRHREHRGETGFGHRM